MNEFDSAMVYANQALNVSKKYHFDFLALKSVDMRAAIYSYTSDFVKASKEYFTAIKMGGKIHKRHTINGHVNLSHVFLMLSNNKKCREYGNKAYKLAIKHNDTAVTTLNILSIYGRHIRSSLK